jgi:cell division protein FtsW
MDAILKRTKGDRVIWIVVIILSLVSMLAVYSSTGSLAFKYENGNTQYYLLKHFMIFSLGIAMMYLAHLVNYRYYSRISQLLLYISVPLLALTLLFGTDINDAKRWLTIPVINLSFQTSDLAKLALIMYLARVLSKNQNDIKDLKKGFLPAMIPTVIVCGLIAPSNLSTSAILFATAVLLMFIGRISIKHLALSAGAGIGILAIIILLALNTSFHARVLTWENRMHSFGSTSAVSSTTDINSSYQVNQAKIAIARGQVFGVGPGNSLQRNFLPSCYSDYIFAIILEEYGMIGAIALITLYLLFLLRCIKIFVNSPGAFGAFLAVGLSFSLVIQALINMMVVVNLLPVTGVTLPLVSMGGTSLWFTSIAIGIVLSVSQNVKQEETIDVNAA